VPVGVVEMRIGFPMEQLNKSEDVADESSEIVTDEMRDNLNYFMLTRNFTCAPGEMGWSFFVYQRRVNASHLVFFL
jgi:hypothetical protein